MTNPEIPEEAVMGLARAFFFAKRGVDWDFAWSNEPKRVLAKQEALEFARTNLAAALPHLRVQETRPTRDQIAKAMHDGHRMHPWGGTWSGGKCTEVCREGFRIEAEPVVRLLATLPAPHPRPVVDREALAGRLDQLWGWAKSGKTKDPDGGEYYLMDVENVDQFTRHVLALLPTEEGRS